LGRGKGVKIAGKIVDIARARWKKIIREGSSAGGTIGRTFSIFSALNI
jgi:hypothetical protein